MKKRISARRWDDIDEGPRLCSVAAAVVGSAIVGAAATTAASNKSSKALSSAQAGQQGIQQQQMDLAKEQWDRYKTTYGPLEDSFASQAQNYGSEANRQKAAEEAAGDVTSSFSNLRQQLNSTPGLDPSSPVYASLMTRLGVSQAGQTAAAETGARRNVDAIGAARMQDAISMGKGLPSNASASLAGASQTAYGMGQLGLASGQVAAGQAAGVGRMVGGIASTPNAFGGIKSWFNSEPSLDETSVAPVQNSELDTIPSSTMNSDYQQLIPGQI